MNKHILLVMKWLKNPELVSQEELEANKESAYTGDAAAYRATYFSCCADRFTAVSRNASYWVDEYFKYAGEDKQIYIDELGE
jgi:hypothetical protein